MIYKILITILLLNIGLFTQESRLFKTAPDNLTLPAVLTEENGTPKSGSMGAMEQKWSSSSASNGETLLQAFSGTGENSIKQMIKEVLIAANIPESKINKLKINFKSSGVEELAIDKDAVTFKDDFVSKYPGENMFLVTKLYRTKNVTVELIDEGSGEFDAAVKDAVSGGLRYGNKTETTEGNKMTTEIAALTYGYEYVPLTIEKAAETELTLKIDSPKDFSMFSITSILLREGMPYDFFMNVTSSALPTVLEFKMSDKNTKASFRIGGKEGFTMIYTGKAGQSVSFTISGYKIII